MPENKNYLHITKKRALRIFNLLLIVLLVFHVGIYFSKPPKCYADNSTDPDDNPPDCDIDDPCPSPTPTPSSSPTPSQTSTPSTVAIGNGGNSSGGSSSSGKSSKGNGDQLGNQPTLAGEPVDTFSGNFFYEVQDLKINRRAMPIVFTRYYNSQGFELRDFGFKWTHSYSMHIEFTGPTPTSIFLPDGGQYALTFSSGSFTVDPRLHATFTQMGTSYLLTFKNKTVWTFDGTKGLITSITDRNNNTINFVYTGLRLIQVVDTTGLVALTFNYSGNIVTSMTDSGGRVFNYSYDSNNNLIGVSYPGGLSATYQYDSDSDMTFFSDDKAKYPGFRKMNLIYATSSSGLEQVVEEQDALANPIFDFDYSGPTAVTDGNGNETDYFTTGPGKLVQKKFPDGTSQFFSYDPGLDITMFKDENGNVTNATYDSQGNLLSVTDPLLNVTSYTYNSFSEVLTQTDANGFIYNYFYDANGNLTSWSDPLGNTTVNTYDGFGELLTRKDANSHVSSFTYDSLGNLASFTDPLFHVTSFQHDVFGRTTVYQDANSKTTNFIYDLADRQVTTTYADGTSTQYTYDNHGNISTFKDPNGNTTKYIFNFLDELNEIDDALLNPTKIIYDIMGNRIKITDANLHSILYAFDNRNRMINETDGNGHTTKTWVYDGVGNITKETDGNGVITSYIFSPLGQILSDGTNSYAYDAVGNLASMTDFGGTTNFTYDMADRLTAVANTLSTITYQYDGVGNRIQMQVAASTIPTFTNAYTYDSNNQLKSVTDDGGRTTQYFYNNVNLLNAIHRPNNVNTVYTYQLLNYTLLDIRSHLGAGLVDFNHYTYDLADNKVSMANSLGTNSYTHDVVDQLTNVNYAAGRGFETFTYDPVGNRKTLTTSIIGRPPVTNYNYDAANQLLNAMSSSTILYAYDGNGNQIMRGGTSYQYDNFNNLNKIIYPAGSGLSFSGFTYDGLGRRAVKKDTSGTSVYIYDGRDVVVEIDTDPSSSVTKSIFTNGLNVVSKKIIPPSLPSQTLYYLYDDLGNVNQTRDDIGNLVQAYDYDVFGKTYNISSDPKNKNQFVGGWGLLKDDDSQFVFMNARYYDPEIGRFIQRDPIDVYGGTNLYRYVDNDPLSFIDPFGLFKIIIQKSSQKMFLTDNSGNLIHSFNVRTGARHAGSGQETPSGDFILGPWLKNHKNEKDVYQYGPWFTRLYHKEGGYKKGYTPLGIHGRGDPKSPGSENNPLINPMEKGFFARHSHGCVRLSNPDDELLHNLLPHPEHGGPSGVDSPTPVKIKN